MNREEAIEKLKSLFEKGDWPLSIDSKKLWDRASISNAQNYLSGWTVIEIERHRGALGAAYTNSQLKCTIKIYGNSTQRFVRFS